VSFALPTVSLWLGIVSWHSSLEHCNFSAGGGGNCSQMIPETFVVCSLQREGKEVRTREVPEDDVPGEYLDKE